MNWVIGGLGIPEIPKSEFQVSDRSSPINPSNLRIPLFGILGIAVAVPDRCQGSKSQGFVEGFSSDSCLSLLSKQPIVVN